MGHYKGEKRKKMKKALRKKIKEAYLEIISDKDTKLIPYQITMFC
jgi:hypothetical protein